MTNDMPELSDDELYTDPATIAAASGLGLVAIVLSGVGLALLALGALG